MSLLALFILDRGFISPPQFLMVDYNFFLQETPHIRNLKSSLKKEGFFRVFVEDSPNVSPYIMDPRYNLETQLIRQKYFLLGHLTYSIPSIRSFGVMDLERLDRILKELDHSKDLKLLSLLGGRYVLTLKTDQGVPEPVAYENSRYLPRLTFINQIKVFPTESDLLDWMLQNSYDPQKLALILEPSVDESRSETKDLQNWSLTSNSQDLPYPSAEIYILQEEVNTLSARVEAKISGLLLLNDTFYPGWKVTVNKIPKDLLQVNYLFKGILLTPGSYEVRFFYEPISYKLGAFITLWTFMGLVSWIVYNLFGAGKIRKA